MKKIMIPFIIVFALATTVLLVSKPGEQPLDPNTVIIDVLEGYARDGSLPYKWISGYDGVTRDLNYRGDVIAQANPDGSHSSFCCGLTFEVYYRSIMNLLQENELQTELNGMGKEDLKDFISLWFVKEKNGDGPGAALKAYGLGESIDNMKDVKKGDFVQIWRTSGSGHSVIFINWTINEDGDTTGMRYWSTQPGTQGVNYNTEYFKEFGGRIDNDITHYSRAFAPDQFIER